MTQLDGTYKSENQFSMELSPWELAFQWDRGSRTSLISSRMGPGREQSPL